jgi:AcrR family transcriptional regulator
MSDASTAAAPATGQRDLADNPQAKTESIVSGRPRRRRDNEVLRAAAKVFAERGYADASIQDLAEELGILKGSVYHYISTKEDLLFWLLEEVHRDVEETLGGVAAAEGLNPIERLDLYVRTQVLYNLENLQRISIYYQDLDHLSDLRRKRILERRAAHNRFVTGLISDAQKQGLANPDLEPKLLSNCVFATIIWTYRWYQPDRGPSREAVADLCAKYALAGVIARPARPPTSLR